MLLRIESTGRCTHHKQVKLVCYYIKKESSRKRLYPQVDSPRELPSASLVLLRAAVSVCKQGSSPFGVLSDTSICVLKFYAPIKFQFSSVLFSTAEMDGLPDAAY
jgi:hypothetical protein